MWKTQSKHCVLLLVVMLLTAALAGCSRDASTDAALHGRVLLWHTWNEADTIVLENVIDQFEELHPGVVVITAAIPSADMPEQFTDAARQGLGPNLLIGSSDWLPALAAQGQLRDLRPLGVDTAEFMPVAGFDVRYGEGLYGLPLSVQTHALIYNREEITQPPLTFDEMRNEANTATPVALPAGFLRAYWGIATRGGPLFTRDGRFTLADSGFESWLALLAEIQQETGIIINTDQETLRQLMVEGRADYLVGELSDVYALQEALGADAVGVTRLPEGPDGRASPLLEVEAVMLGTVSSDNQERVALELARFLTRPQQNATFLREARRVPANIRVSVDPRVYPVLGAFYNQARTAVMLPNTLDQETIFEIGDRAYANVLSGIMTPAESACEFALEVVATQDLPPDEVDLPRGCVPEEGMD